MHLGACLVPFKRHRPWQQRELSAYLTVKACEKEERRWTGGERRREKERGRGRGRDGGSDGCDGDEGGSAGKV